MTSGWFTGGLAPTALMTELTLGVHSGPESVLYAQLQQYCEQLMGRASGELRAIGEAGSKHYAQFQAEPVKEEHHERVYGLQWHDPGNWSVGGILSVGRRRREVVCDSQQR